MKFFSLALAAIVILPAFAQTPPAQYETLPLGHAVPHEIVRQTGWDDASRLPKGVKWIKADDAHNTLIVLADPSGLLQVKAVVLSLDVAPREVEIQGCFVRVTARELKASGLKFERVPLTATPDGKKNASPKYGLIASGDATKAYFTKLTADASRNFQSPLIRSYADHEAAIAVNSSKPVAQPDGTTVNHITFSTGYRVLPRFDSDNSMTLAITASSGNPDETMPLKASRTLKPGETVLLFGGMTDSDGNPLALFLTAKELTAADFAAKP